MSLSKVLICHTSEMKVIIPTNLSKEQVEAFQTVYEKHYKIELDFGEASKKALLLLRFMATILQLSGTSFTDDGD